MPLRAACDALLIASTLLATLTGCNRAASTPQVATSAARIDSAAAVHDVGAASRPLDSPPSDSRAASTQRFASDDRGDGSALPTAIARGLQTDQRVLDCTDGTRGGVSQFAADWVGVRRIDLDDDGRDDWIVNGLHACLRVDGTPAWWVYVDRADGPRLALAGEPGVALEVLATRSGGFRDIAVERGDGRPLKLRAEGESYTAVPDGAAVPPSGLPDTP